MAKFTVRVQIHGVGDESALYQVLDTEMARYGFRRSITGADDTTYELPTGEYTYEGEETGEQVRSAAKEAAARVGRRTAVLVSQSSTRWWSGLKSFP